MASPLWFCADNLQQSHLGLVPCPSMPSLTDQQLLMYNAGMTSASVKSLAKVVSICHALSDETRVRLIERLGEGEQCVCDLTDSFKTGQSRLSFHLKVLKDAGLVIDRREGRWIYYALNRAGMEELEDLVRSLKSTEPSMFKRGRCP